MKFNTRNKTKISNLSKNNAFAITDTVDALNRKVFQDHPLQEPVQASKIINEIFDHDLIKWIVDL